MKSYKYLFMLSVMALALAACSPDENSTDVALSRQFKPSQIAATNGETQVTLTWSASLFTSGGVTYAVEVSRDGVGFTNVEFTGTSTATTMVITDDKLAIKQNYFARVKALGAEGQEDSKWLVSPVFRITGEQYLTQVTSENVIDKSVRLNWKISNDLTKIVITDGTTPMEFTLTAGEKAAGFKQIDGLAPGKAYTVDIYAGTKNKGTVLFNTKAGLVGNVVDLRAISVVTKPNILTDTLPDIPSGSIVLLKRGSSYGITSTATFNFNRSVTIQSGLDFGTDLATLRMSTFFNIVAGSAIDSIVFKDLNIKGGRANRASYDSDYILNASNASTVTRIRLQNCVVKILRGVVRGQTAGTGTKYGEYLINSCVVDSIKDFAVAAASGASAFANIKITNSTFYRIRKLIIHSVAGNNSVSLDNVTIYEAPGGAAVATTNFMMDFGSNNSAGGISIKNTIFGKTWDETGAGTLSSGIRAGTSTNVSVTNSYATNDFVNNANAIPGLLSYSGASTALWTDPVNFNFKIKDSNFVGKASAGDGRWR